jgi:hypothetical protein
MIAFDLNEQVRRPNGAIFMPYAPDHVSYINTNNKDILCIGDSVSREQLVTAQANMGEATTVMIHGQPVGVFGMVPLWPGVAEMWFIPDERLRAYPIFMTRGGRAFMDITRISYGLHRQQITVRCDHEAAVKWANAIGFKQEAILKAYGTDKADFYMMSIVRQT